MKTIKEIKINKNYRTTYTYGYGSLLNVLFHIRILINVFWVTWLLFETNGMIKNFCTIRAIKD